jgi:hypothetical protein
MRYILRRPRAFWISVCNLLGLACSMAGVVMLFWYALPNEPPGAPVGLTADSSGEEHYDDARRLYERYSHIGLYLVLVGTFLEAVPPFCTAIGSWRRRPIAPQPRGREETEPQPRRSPPVNSKPVQEGPSMEAALPLIRLLHDNMAIVITFVFSQAPIRRLIKERFKGYPERMEDFSFEVPRRNATRACLEIAVFMRLIDDRHKVVDYLRQTNQATLHCFGVVHLTDETTEFLSLRELTNKIIHAADLSWDLSDEQAPKLICTAPDDQKDKYKWIRAEVDIVNLALFCDGFAAERI